MTKRTRRNHTPAFKAKVALAALKGEKTLAELASFFSPADARALALADGDLARVTSRYGSASLPTRLDPSVPAGVAFATFHDPAVRLNRLTGPHRDALVGTPEYKVTAVRIERAGAGGAVE